VLNSPETPQQEEGSNTILIRGTADESKLLRWLYKHASKDTNRPVLTGIHVASKSLIVADGFRLVCIPLLECMKDHVGKTLGFANPKGKFPSGAFIVEMVEIEGTYPDVSSVIPANEPVAEIAFDANLLRTVLSSFEKKRPTLLRVFSGSDGSNGQPFEVSQNLSDDLSKRYAIIMPMHHSKSDTLFWRPIDPLETDDDEDETEE
jgi:hypothetical protein